MFTKGLTPFLLLLLCAIATPAHAYIGPGAGAGTIAVVFGILGSVVMAFFSILWYPFKRLLKRFKAKEASREATTEKTAAETGAGPEAS